MCSQPLSFLCDDGNKGIIRRLFHPSDVQCYTSVCWTASVITKSLSGEKQQPKRNWKYINSVKYKTFHFSGCFWALFYICADHVAPIFLELQTTSDNPSGSLDTNLVQHAGKESIYLFGFINSTKIAILYYTQKNNSATYIHTCVTTPEHYKWCIFYFSLQCD